MGRGWPVIKREFTEMVRTKAFIIGTLLGPFLIALLFLAPLAFMRAGGGAERQILILDASSEQIGQGVQATLQAMNPDDSDGMGSVFRVELKSVSGEATAEKRAARERVAAEESSLDGFLYLPEDVTEGGTAQYEGTNATSVTQMAQVRSALNQAVRGHRLQEEGVAPSVLARVMRSVPMEARRPGSDEEEGEGAEAALVVGMMMAMGVYFPIILFATAVMRGVLEEKRDRIVEVLLSSIKARQFVVGKVLGIGSASLVQILVWVGFIAAALTWGPGIAEHYGASLPFEPPNIPGRVGVVFLFFFLTGFLLYAAMFGAAGAIATSEQEANQMQFPVTIPLVIGIFFMYALMNDPDSGLAVAGSLIPFTAPVVMPMRAMMTDIPLMQYIAAGVLMVGTVIMIMWAAAKIYHIGVLSTGKRPSMKELLRWLRTA